MGAVWKTHGGLGFALTLGAVLALWPEAAQAQDGALNGANTAWILTSTALVLFMTLPGLALFCCGWWSPTAWRSVTAARCSPSSAASARRSWPVWAGKG